MEDFLAGIGILDSLPPKLESHMRGNSVRAICDDFGIKSTQTVWGGIQRGKEAVIEQGIDIEERRIEIDQIFKNTLGYLAKAVEQQ